MLRLAKFARVLIVCPVLIGAGHTANINSEMLRIPSGTLHSVIPPGEEDTLVHVAAFHMQRMPVSNAEFLDFIKSHPQWRRDNVSPLFAEGGYLAHWANAEALGEKVRPDQPVTRVSWFAATAYCEAKGWRLPDWYEWEYVAAADEKRSDARHDPRWRQKILGWYAQTGGGVLPERGREAANYFGLHDLHGLIWEWVQDYNALLVGADNREQGGADKLEFCGAGALNMRQKEQYAVLMRVAMLSSLEAAYTTANLGFRCAKNDTRENRK